MHNFGGQPQMALGSSQLSFLAWQHEKNSSQPLVSAGIERVALKSQIMFNTTVVLITARMHTVMNASMLTFKSRTNLEYYSINTLLYCVKRPVSR